jgi:hypothetical protein
MEKESEILKLYADGISPTKISNVLNVNRRTIYRIFQKNNITFEKKSEKKKCLICENITASRRNRCDTCNTKIRRYRAKKAAVDYLGGKCIRCGWIGNLAGYDFHHKDSSVKDFNPSAVELANKSWRLVKDELDKCELLCAICHRLEHNDYGNETFLSIANNEHSNLVFKE